MPLFVASGLLVGCGEADPAGTSTGTSNGASGQATRATVSDPGRADQWSMPAEEEPHQQTWMCWPSSEQIWGPDLVDVQDAIIRIATAIARFEPVTMLARPEEIEALGEILEFGVEVLEAPVDDLWARDTLPNFVVRSNEAGALEMAAAHATFNGWGGKQVHDGDTQLAALVADQLGVPLLAFGLVGEIGAVEVDGRGTVLLAESCWVNDNRNPGMTRGDIEAAILDMLGADRMIWVDGLAGADITDRHIDTLARFADPSTIVVDTPAFDDPADPWVAVAARTKSIVTAATTIDGQPYDIVEMTQPMDVRWTGNDFLSTYMNYYVCNGAVIAPEFGDGAADEAARAVLAQLFPDREIVMLDIDALAAGGGGIHCATQQQPRLS